MDDFSGMSSLFTVPRHVAMIEGMTITYLRVYEVIFQFLNRGRSCYLGNKEMQRRAQTSYTQMKAALMFFEEKGLLRRVTQNGKRFIMIPQVELKVDDDEPTNDESFSVDNSPEGVGLPTGGGVGLPTLGGVGLPTQSKSFKKSSKSNKQSRTAVDKNESECPNKLDDVLCSDSKRIIERKGLDAQSVFKKFHEFYSKRKIMMNNWTAAFKKWVTDENKSISANKSCTYNDQSEVRSTVKEWAPGNEDYDRLHG